MTSRAVAAEARPGVCSRCSQPCLQEALGSAAEPSFPASAQCGVQQGGVSSRELGEPIHIFKGLASCMQP